MPIYEYRCADCGETSEFLTGLGADDSIFCRHCGSVRMQKILSAAAVVRAGHERSPGHTCCGREERCETPPCSAGSGCSRH
jgi:putative FmdB family regulatory protein